MLSEEFEFHRDDLVEVSFLIPDYFLEYFFLDGPVSVCIESLIFSEILYFDDIRSFRDIHLNRFVSPEVSFLLHFFFGESIVYQVSGCILEVEGIEISGKEFSESSIPVHLSEYLICEGVPFFFGVLFVQYTVGFVLESDAAETEGTMTHRVGIVDITTSTCVRSDVHIGTSLSASHPSVDIITFPYIKAIVYLVSQWYSVSESQVSSIRRSGDHKTVFDVLGKSYPVSLTINGESVFRFCRIFREKIQKPLLLFENIGFLLKICFFVEFFVIDAVRLILQIITENTFSTSDKVGGKPYITGISDVFAVENIKTVRSLKGKIDIFRIGSYKYRVQDISHIHITHNRV